MMASTPIPSIPRSWTPIPSEMVSSIAAPVDSPRILIYRDTLIPPSETFIPAQVGALTRYQACYGGTIRSTPSLPLNAEAICLGDGLGDGLGPGLAPGLAIAAAWERQLAPLWKTRFKTLGQIPPAWLDRLRQRNPRLIHAHFGPDGTFALPLARALGVPLVVTFHGYDATMAGSGEARSALALTRQFIQQRGTFYREQYLRRRSRLFAEADCIIAVSQFIADRLLAAGCPPEKLRVHYIGIDRSLFVPRSRGSSPDGPILLFVGRLVEKKGAADLIQALAQLRSSGQFPQAPRLILIGDGPLRSALEAQAQSSNINAQFLGHQSPEAVRQWLSRADIFAVPSRIARSGDGEGLGMVFAEAQAMGVPVVSCRSGGVPEVVCDGKTGLLVPEADPAALAAALGQLLADETLRHNLGAAGPKWVADRFDLQTNTAQLETIYDEMLARHSNPTQHPHQP
jgi:colanic acid/amylovoran biosynthesis glycosyltransferase